MAIWPLYHADDPVACFHCAATLGRAGDGTVIGFGDGNGNREQICPACGLKTFYDVTRHPAEAAAFMHAHGVRFEEERAIGIRARAAQGLPFWKALARARGAASGARSQPGDRTELATGGGVRAPAPAAPSPDTPTPRMAFDLSGIIQQETRTS